MGRFAARGTRVALVWRMRSMIFEIGQLSKTAYVHVYFILRFYGDFLLKKALAEAPCSEESRGRAGPMPWNAVAEQGQCRGMWWQQRADVSAHASTDKPFVSL